MTVSRVGHWLTKFVVVESLEDTDVKTGEFIAAYLRGLVVDHAPDLGVELVQCESARQFREALAALRIEATSKGARPALHIDCHGSIDGGLEFANGSALPWDELALELTELNVATEFNLLASLSACFGGYLLGKMNAVEPAACWCVVAPTNTIEAAEAMRVFRGFYRTMLTMGNVGAAAVELANAPASQGQWFAQLAESWFERLVDHYVRTHCTIEAVELRSRSMSRAARDRGQRLSIGKAKRGLRRVHRDNLLGKYFDQYFCTDRVPDARQRFDVTRQRLLKSLDNLRATGKFDL